MSEPYVHTLETIKEFPNVEVEKQPRMTNRQLDFLRNLRKHPNSLPLMTWPRTTTLRKWMRRPRFRAAIEGLVETFQIESRLLMAGAATQAAVQLNAVLTGGDGSLTETGCGTSPSQLNQYHGTMKQLLGVLWMEMARRQDARREESGGQAPVDAEAAPGDVL